jgi:hypothetical protein
VQFTYRPEGAMMRRNVSFLHLCVPLTVEFCVLSFIVVFLEDCRIAFPFSHTIMHSHSIQQEENIQQKEEMKIIT